MDDKVVKELNELIKQYDIDIELLNELYQIGENEKDFYLIKNENGEIIKEKQKLPYKFIEWLKNFKIIKYIIEIIISYKTEEPKVCGIMNAYNNCYINAALQIFSRCYSLIIELFKCNYKEDELIELFLNSMMKLLFDKDKYYNPKEFIECFCKKNKDFNFGKQNCSQNFIRTLLKNINDVLEKNVNDEYYFPKDQKEKEAYNKFIEVNKIYPESKPYSIFSGIIKNKIKGKCSFCGEEICNYSFSNFVDQNLYLNSFSKETDLLEVLKKNIGNKNNAKMKCPYCKKKISLESILKFIKIPEIFIFTLERYLERNKVPIIPNEQINIFNFVDKSCSIDEKECNYELFAINIRIGNDLSSGHEICQIKEKNKWYTINDDKIYQKNEKYYENNYGLFYKKIHL